MKKFKVIKSLIIGLMLSTTLSAVAETTDLSLASSVSCVSEGLGSFYIAGLYSTPFINFSTRKYIEVKSKNKDALVFKYRDFQTNEYRLYFNNSVAHEDGNGRVYKKRSGFFVNGHIESPIECLLE